MFVSGLASSHAWKTIHDIHLRLTRTCLTELDRVCRKRRGLRTSISNQGLGSYLKCLIWMVNEDPSCVMAWLVVTACKNKLKFSVQTTHEKGWSHPMNVPSILQRRVWEMRRLTTKIRKFLLIMSLEVVKGFPLKAFYCRRRKVFKKFPPSINFTAPLSPHGMHWLIWIYGRKISSCSLAHRFRQRRPHFTYDQHANLKKRQNIMRKFVLLSP